MKELTLRRIENLLVMMSGIQEEHPKADVTYDPEKERINITYPLPRDLQGTGDAPYQTNS